MPHRFDTDLIHAPLGTGTDGNPVFLRDIWPTQKEVSETVAKSVTASAMFSRAASRMPMMLIPTSSHVKAMPTITSHGVVRSGA